MFQARRFRLDVSEKKLIENISVRCSLGFELAAQSESGVLMHDILLNFQEDIRCLGTRYY